MKSYSEAYMVSCYLAIYDFYDRVVVDTTISAVFASHCFRSVEMSPPTPLLVAWYACCQLIGVINWRQVVAWEYCTFRCTAVTQWTRLLCTGLSPYKSRQTLKILKSKSCLGLFSYVVTLSKYAKLNYTPYVDRPFVGVGVQAQVL